MTDLTQATATGTEPVPVAGTAANAGNAAVFQLLTGALSALHGADTSDPTAIALLSAALAALASPSATAASTATVTAAATPAPTAPPTIPTPIGAVAPPATPTLRTAGPWIVEGLYLVVPTGPLTAVIDDGQERLWYCITKGRYVGVTTVNALAMAAVTGVSSASMISHKTQASAIGSFNTLLSLGLIEIR